MAAKFHKKNKRMKARLKYKIVKKVNEHNRKVRKDKKKNPGKYKRKDPGVPNSLPFKEEILREAEERKQQAIDLREAQKANRLKIQMQNRSLEDLVVKAQSNVTHKRADRASLENTVCDKSTKFKSYYKELKKVVDTADVLLEVLDSRDPLGSRCPEIEQMVINCGKKLVLVINKIDLVPRANLEAWLSYLRQELPTVAFKSSTQMQSSNLSHSKVAAIHINTDMQESSRCIGASFLMKVLGNYARSKDIKTSIIVGVVGYPNVGKSSIINSLKRSRSCSVGATAGVTKSIQEISLDKHIKILDSPGIVFAKNGSQTTLALRNIVNVETLKDAIAPAEAIVQRANHSQLCLHYTIPEFSSCHELLCFLAKRMGKFKKGGIPNAEEGARRLINDWNRGFIKYYSHPPESYKPSEHIPLTIVSEFSKAFDISEFDEKMELDKAPTLFPSKGVAMKSTELTQEFILDKDQDIEADDSTSKNQISVAFKSKKKKKSSKSEELIEGLKPREQQNKLMKKKFKRMKRQKKKLEKVADALSDKMDIALNI